MQVTEEEIKRALQLIPYHERTRKIFLYRPYGHADTLSPGGSLWQSNYSQGIWERWSNKPWQLDFHAAGANYQERMLMAANRPGKTDCGAAETAIHLTGEYPDWWTGKVFKQPVLWWTGSPTNETSRNIVQHKLIGGTDNELFGTGFIPKANIIGRPKVKQAGVSDVVESIAVRHKTGGTSICILKSYEQGWRKWQGTEPHGIWLDEEPMPNETEGKIYTEALTRLLTSHGIMLVTFTPLQGNTQLVSHYIEGGDGIYLMTATWDDAPHILLAERRRIENSYPEHERDARVRGVPMLGSGRVFTEPEDNFLYDHVDFDESFARIKGIDFGIDHPAGFCELVWDRDKDIIYLDKDGKKSNMQAEEHAAMINDHNPWVPVAWPHDGTTRDKGSGVELRHEYLKHGVKMLSKSARYKNDVGGGQPIEPIIMHLKARISDGGFRVNRKCTSFREEYRFYHRKDGIISAKKDDVLKSVFYALMMRRYAKTRVSGYRHVNMPAPSVTM